ncbi:MAG TPA: class I SAM-dependent methyltransferase [Thermomicrobiales bacterium]|nr:class I SAM-dependent methyltransferase [Thermomicrobiales bacterium]
MRLAELHGRALPPGPWREADTIPWDDPVISARMLREHLDQSHDAASRRAATIDRQVAWIDREVLRGRPTAILDLGCGPGLYTSRLGRRGHTCVGLDYSPAAIAHAAAEAAAAGLACRYERRDLRDGDYGRGFGLALFLYGELNAFPPDAAGRILAAAWRALADDGLLLLEPHTRAGLRRRGDRPPTWYTAARGLFGDTPYLCLREDFWDRVATATTTRYFVVDLATGAVTRYAESLQAYSAAGYRRLLAGAGFAPVATYPSLEDRPTPGQGDLCAIVARKAPTR